MDKLVQTLGITGLSKSQVLVMAKELDEHVEAFRTRRLEESSPFTFVAADALVLKVCEGGRVVPAVAEHLEGARADILAFTPFPKEVWRQTWSKNLKERLSCEIRECSDVAGIFQTGPASSGSSAPSWSNSTTSGSKDAATSDSTSSPAPRPSTRRPKPCASPEQVSRCGRSVAGWELTARAFVWRLSKLA